MPDIVIHQAKGRTTAQKRAAVRAITKAVAAAYRCPAQQVVIFIQEYEPHHWAQGGVTGAEAARKKRRSRD